jgi:hypothetical protein
VPESDVFASEVAGGVPSASAAIGGHEVPKATASPPPNPTPLARVVLLEVEVEKSMQEEMVALEELLQFGPDPFLEATLPEEGEACPPLMVEAPALTVGMGPSTGA